jgi:colicin import membrane protein
LEKKLREEEALREAERIRL